MKYFTTAIYFLLVGVITANAAEDFQYVSPKPNSLYNSQNSTIILKHSDYIDKQSITTTSVRVTGNNGKIYNGKIKLSTDGKTIVFVPDHPFELGETIKVYVPEGIRNISGETIEMVSFSFAVENKSVNINFDVIGNDIRIIDDSELAVMPNPELNYEPVFNPDTLPDDFPEITVTQRQMPEPGAYFFAHKGDSKGDFLIVMSNEGKVLAYKRTPAAVGRYTVQPNGLITYNQRVKSYFMAFADAMIYVMDANFKLVDSIVAKNGIATAPHTCVLLPNGHILLTAFEAHYVDISEKISGGHHNALLAGSIFQELDADKNLIFQWRSWDFYDITETSQNLKIPVTLFSNINAVDLDKDGNYLLSNRLFSEILKIERTTGNVLWRLGGLKNEFTFFNENEANAPFYFSLQHDIRYLPNGRITLFDNGGQHKPQYSRGVLYELDEEKKIAGMVWEYRHTPDVFGSANGSMQTISVSKGIYGIAWGSLADTTSKVEYTEVRANGTVDFEFNTPPYYNSLCVLKFPWPVNKPVAEVQLNEIMILNNYTFDKDDKKTQFSLTFSEMEAFMYNHMIVTKFEYGPQNPRFEGMAPIVAPYRFNINGYSIDSFTGEFRFTVSDMPWIIEPEKWKIYYRETIGSGVFKPLETTFDSFHNELICTTSHFGEYIFAKDYPQAKPSIPKLAFPENNSSVNYLDNVGFIWSNQGVTSSSRLQVSTDSEFTPDRLKLDTILNESVFNYKFTAHSENLFWRVKGINQYSEGSWSVYWKFTLDEPDIKLSYPNGGESLSKAKSHFIRWNQNFADTVRIELFKNGILDKIIAEKTITQTGTWLWNIPNDAIVDSSYTIKVTSLKYNNVESQSAGLFKIDDTGNNVEINNNYNTFKIIKSIYPNPANNNYVDLRINLEKASKVGVSIYNITGVKKFDFHTELMDRGVHDIQIGLTEFESGIYTLRIEAEDQFESDRLIIVK